MTRHLRRRLVGLISAKTGCEQMQQMTRANARLLDDLVGELLEVQRYVEPERPSSFEINHKLELSRLLNWQITGLLAAEYPIDIRCCPTVLIDDINTVGNQAACGGKILECIERGQPVARR